ncbi:unnamed protein product [Pleuronectes platessa]|uniref:Uncharacterized protein n=1 Tax=Pleuronectes platessa TaxID=8262 RepID=A0A9N7V0T9_PLEPL|nr:unnamed protein product [Pleuronectes platessa]
MAAGSVAAVIVSNSASVSTGPGTVSQQGAVGRGCKPLKATLSPSYSTEIREYLTGIYAITLTEDCMEDVVLPSRGCIWADKVSDPARRTDQWKPLRTNPQRLCPVTYNRCLSDLKSPNRPDARAPPEYEIHKDDALPPAPVPSRLTHGPMSKADSSAAPTNMETRWKPLGNRYKRSQLRVEWVDWEVGRSHLVLDTGFSPHSSLPHLSNLVGICRRHAGLSPNILTTVGGGPALIRSAEQHRRAP